MDLLYEIRDIKADSAALLLHETLFHNANGYIGIRSCFEEGYPAGRASIRGSYINGFYDFTEMPQAEKLPGLPEEKQTMLNVADTQGIRLFLDGEEFSLWSGTVLESRRTLDMAAGFTGRYVHWRSDSGKEAEIRIRRLASFARPSLFLIDYSVTALNFEGPIRFLSSHRGNVENHSDPGDPRLAAESLRRLIPIRTEREKTASFITAQTLQSKLLVCTAVDHALPQGPGGADIQTDIPAEGEASCRIDARVGMNETIRLCKYTVFKDSIRHGDCGAAAREELAALLKLDPEILYREQREYLDAWWEGAFLEIEGNDDLARSVKYNLYQLAQSAGRDEYGSVAAKGLSGEGYEGHFFWDTEMYIEPFFIFTNPAIARNLIAYRYATLDEARKNARLMGHGSGALFPWRTIMGRECSGFFPAGAAQYHINGDIAWSVVSYYVATGDIDFISRKGAELVFECARLWIDTGNYYQGRFHINDVSGPDEYTCIVNNNYYTNVSARYNLWWAVKLYRLLEQAGTLETIRRKIGLEPDEIQAFAEAAEKMYLPYDETLGINPQDDSFLSKKRWDIERTPREHFPLLLHYHPLYLYRHQICKQADTVMAHFVFEDAQSRETIRRSFLYYEGVSAHDSSLSTCIFSIVASRLGYHEKAYRYFGDSAKLDLFDTHGNTKDGIHTANMGGTYMAILYGFAGLRLKETGLCFSPHLPASWTAYRFRILYRGSSIQAEIGPEAIRFTLLAGNEQIIHVYDREYVLAASLVLAPQRETPKYRAVIFDLDGVLVSTDRQHFRAWKAIAAELEIPFDEKINNRLRGVSRMESLEIILKSGGLVLDAETKAALAERKNRIYRQFLHELDHASVDAGVTETLKGLKAAGIGLAVGSSSKNARFILEKTGLAPYFDAVAGGEDITRPKPDPEVFVKAAAMLGTDAADTLVVEDASAGIEAASAGGFDSAALGAARNSLQAVYCLENISGLGDIIIPHYVAAGLE